METWEMETWMNVRPVGFYEELLSHVPEEVSSGRIEEAVRVDGPPDALPIFRYLKSGHEVFSAMGATRDVISKDEFIIGADSVLTDGTWVWRADLRHYFYKHNTELPEEFISHIRDLDYTVPHISEAEFADASAWHHATFLSGGVNAEQK